MKKLTAKKIGLSQKVNENVFVEVDDCEDMVPEIEIRFVNSSIVLTRGEKYQVSKALFNELKKVIK